MKNNIQTNYNIKTQQMQDEIFRKMTPEKRAQLSASFSDFVLRIGKLRDQNEFSGTADKN